MNTDKMRVNKNLIAVLFLFLVALASYANIFHNDFAWDDFFFIVDNIHIRSLDEIPGFFAEPSTGHLYRPLRSVFYAVTYQIWQLNVFGYHLNAFFLHFFITVLLFFITIKITDKTAFSFVVSLLFAAHPVHTARITNMTAAFDAYGILFLLLSFLFYILFSKNRKKYYYWLSIAVYLLALFSSEEAITLILILFLYDFSFNYKLNLNNAGTLLKKYMPYVIVTVFYLIIRFLVVERIGRGEFYFEHSFAGTFLTTIKVFVQYIIILFLPFGLTEERYVKFDTAFISTGFIISLAALLLIFFFFIKSYKKSKIVFFSIGWFFITLLPFSNLVPQFTIMADRYLYLPSYGFVLLLTLSIFQINKIRLIKKYSNVIVVLLVLLITSSYTVLTIQRNAEWKDEFTLLSSDVEKNPLGTRLHHALALYYRDRGDYETALAYANRAVELASKNYNAYENIGTINAYKKNYDEAIKFYSKALELNPDFYLAANNLGLVYSYLGDFNSSVFYLKKAVGIDPKLSKAHNDLGTVYAQIGKFDPAIGEMEKSIEINPYNADYYYNLAVIYEFLGNNNKAIDLLEKGLDIEPDNEKIKGRINKLDNKKV